MEPIPVRPGFTLYIFDCTSSLYALNVLATNGLGPTKLISPFKILMICGNSFIFVLRRNLPGATKSMMWKLILVLN